MLGIDAARRSAIGVAKLKELFQFMTTDEIKTTVKHHRGAAMTGGIVGLALLVGYLAYHFAMTPARPDLRKAPPAEVIAYISNDRGFAGLPQIEQRQFVERWGGLLREDAKRCEDLRGSLETLSEEQRRAFTEAMFAHFKRAFLDDAKQYARLPSAEQYGFLKKQIDEGGKQLLLLRDLTTGLKNPFAENQDEFQKWLMEHTTPEERATGEPYFNALKHIRPQVEKEGRAGPRPPTPTSKP